MADLSAQTKTDKDVSCAEEISEPVCVTGTTIYKGLMVGLNASGLAISASAATCVKVIGRALEDTKTAAGVSGAAAAGSRIRVEQGVFIWANVGSMTDTSVEKLCYVSDNHSVAATGTVVAGIVKKIDAAGVHVLTASGMGSTNSNTVMATFVYTANDFAVPNNPPNGATYDVATTGAASTISLPATAINGTKIYFHADGTKNGHTVTYRDVATAISAAATASKRHLAVASFLGTTWTVALVVGP